MSLTAVRAFFLSRTRVVAVVGFSTATADGLALAVGFAMSISTTFSALNWAFLERGHRMANVTEINKTRQRCFTERYLYYGTWSKPSNSRHSAFW
uniref:Uncharacterized protein n=1 Tax=Ixodes ricinus TaxID=34613 RepID=A0A6B0UD89_IXORI